MMQDRQMEEFDLMVKSMLEDAGVKAPSGVWSAISSRLGTGKPQASGRMWRWAGVAVAACAASLAAFLITGNVRQEDMPESQDLVAIVGNTSEAPLTAMLESAEKPVTEEARPVKSAPKAVSEPVGSHPVNAVASDHGAETDVRPEEKATPAVPEETAAAPERSTGEVSGDAGSKPDPFAVLEWESRRKSSGNGKVSVSINGDISSNDSELGSRGGNIFNSSSSISPLNKGIEEKSVSTYGIPVSFGAEVRFGILPRLSVGTGLQYSLLTRTFYGSYNLVNADIEHRMQYIGIPVNLYFDILDSDIFRLYTFGGGAVEKGLSNVFKFRDGAAETIKGSVEGLQWSAGVGFGVEFKISDMLGIYIDPSARYYFDCNQPKSVRTDRPFMVDLKAGLRFNF